MSITRNATAVLCSVVTVATMLPMSASAAQPTANDTRAGATEITGLPHAVDQNVEDMTTDTSDPNGCYDRPERTVWYRYTAETAGRLVASTAGSSFSTMLEVLEGSGSSLSSVRCMYDSDPNTPGTVISFAAKKGRTYFFVVGRTRYSDAPQRWDLSFALRPQPDVAVSVDDKTHVDTDTGDVTVTGTTVCSEDVSIQIQPQLQQSRSKGTAYAGGSGYIECTATQQWFSVTLSPYGRVGFTDGRATLHNSVQVFTEAIYENTETPATVTTCTLVGTIGDDTLTGTTGNDRICALAGDDTIVAGGGNDVVFGGPGADVIRLGGGDDWASGQDGADRLLGGRGNDTLLGGRGKDTLRGGAGYDRCTGGPARDTFRGCEVVRQQ